MDTIYDPYSYPPRGLSREAAARYIGVSPLQFDLLVAADRVPKPFKLEGSVVWDRISLDIAFSALTAADDAADRATENNSRPAFVATVLDPQRLAERWSCSATHVRKMIERGEIPAFKFGDKMLRIVRHQRP